EMTQRRPFLRVSSITSRSRSCIAGVGSVCRMSSSFAFAVGRDKRVLRSEIRRLLLLIVPLLTNHPVLQMLIQVRGRHGRRCVASYGGGVSPVANCVTFCGRVVRTFAAV